MKTSPDFEAVESERVLVHFHSGKTTETRFQRPVEIDDLYKLVQGPPRWLVIGDCVVAYTQTIAGLELA